jgi:transcriptional regulator with XRE-family HTH domain
MAISSPSMLSLVPGRRLGALLKQRREMHGYTLDDMARRSVGQFTVMELAGIEAGEANLDDDSLEALSLLYEFNSTPPIPQRSRLIIASDEEIPVAVGLEPDDPETSHLVMSRYLALLYLLRNLSVGDDLPLRGDDLAVLADAYGLSAEDVAAKLGALVSNLEELADQVERLRRRLVVPAAGLLVGPTPSGVLVLVK